MISWFKLYDQIFLCLWEWVVLRSGLLPMKQADCPLWEVREDPINPLAPPYSEPIPVCLGTQDNRNSKVLSLPPKHLLAFLLKTED